MSDDPVNHAEDEPDWRGRAQAAEQALAEALAQTERRLIHAELKAAALAEGMVDMDGLRLIDTDALRLDDHGALAEGSRLMRQMRRDKPWLFGGFSTSSGARPPAAHPPQQRLATEMSQDEWRAARAALLRAR